MISKYDVKTAFKRAEVDGIKTNFRYDEETECLYDWETGDKICNLDVYVQYLAKKHHCDFECIYSDHASLTTIYRCKDCGTVIFGGDDERFDPNLKCPTCGEYSTWLEFWTQEEIENEEAKQKAIEFYYKLTEMQDAQYARMKLRNGLYDWQLWKMTKYFKFCCIHIEFQVQDITKGLSGLRAELNISKKDKNNDVTYMLWKSLKIPLSPHAFYIQYIYPYSKKCHKDFRKYYFWQKKLKQVRYANVL